MILVSWDLVVLITAYDCKRSITESFTALTRIPSFLGERRLLFRESLLGVSMDYLVLVTIKVISK